MNKQGAHEQSSRINHPLCGEPWREKKNERLSLVKPGMIYRKKQQEHEKQKQRGEGKKAICI